MNTARIHARAARSRASYALETDPTFIAVALLPIFALAFGAAILLALAAALVDDMDAEPAPIPTPSRAPVVGGEA